MAHMPKPQRGVTVVPGVAGRHTVHGGFSFFYTAAGKGGHWLVRDGNRETVATAPDAQEALRVAKCLALRRYLDYCFLGLRCYSPNPVARGRWINLQRRACLELHALEGQHG